MSIISLSGVRTLSRVGQPVLYRSAVRNVALGAGAALAFSLTLGSSSAYAQEAVQEVPTPADSPEPAVTADKAPAQSSGAKEEKKEEKEKVRLGIIASQGKFADNTNIETDSVGAVPGDEVGMITGAIARKSKSECIARLQNAGKKGYSVSFEVIGTDKSGNKVLSRSFSGTVRAGGSFERNVSGCRDGLNLAVNLRSAKPL